MQADTSQPEVLPHEEKHCGITQRQESRISIIIVIIIIRAQAPKVGRPIEIERIILIILIIVTQINWLFEGFNKSLPKFADSYKVVKIYVFWSI